MSEPVDPKHFRSVLGAYPTGVTVVAGMDGDEPVGLAIGSFTSVSLDPPLVSFCPGHSSSSWPRIAASGSFCVNVLAADQSDVSGVFASSSDDKFAGLSWDRSPTGSPRLAGVAAWIDCDIEAVHAAGDHDIVVGRVRALDVGDTDAGPLLFLGGAYGRFSQ